MKLFSVAKVGLYLDDIKHSLEDRKGGETKIISLTLRLQPFDHKLATALDSVVRTTLFKLNHPDPAPYLRVVEFALAVPRQQLHIFASPDTKKAAICLDQVKIAGIRARTEKSVNGWGLTFRASFGPAGKTELEYVEAWRTQQRFVTFEEAEPSLEFEETESVDEESDPRATRPAPMWEDDEPPAVSDQATAGAAKSPVQ